jgi:hypothetical protein
MLKDVWDMVMDSMKKMSKNRKGHQRKHDVGEVTQKLLP